MKKILIASHIEEEIIEIKNILGIDNVNFVSLFDLEVENITNEVIGFTLEKNVRMKAKKYYEEYHLPVITCDRELEIDSLNNFPGVFANKIYSENSEMDINMVIVKIKGFG